MPNHSAVREVIHLAFNFMLNDQLDSVTCSDKLVASKSTRQLYECPFLSPFLCDLELKFTINIDGINLARLMLSAIRRKALLSPTCQIFVSFLEQIIWASPIYLA